MAKIQHRTHRPPQVPKKPQEEPAVKETPLKMIAREVYESTPLTMLCSKPGIRELASKIPVIKEVAEAICPAFGPLDEYVRKDLLK